MKPVFTQRFSVSNTPRSQCARSVASGIPAPTPEPKVFASFARDRFMFHFDSCPEPLQPFHHWSEHGTGSDQKRPRVRCYCFRNESNSWVPCVRKRRKSHQEGVKFKAEKLAKYQQVKEASPYRRPLEWPPSCPPRRLSTKFISNLN